MRNVDIHNILDQIEKQIEYELFIYYLMKKRRLNNGYSNIS